uniref:G-protein coupled receptors family 1 profile domain-containing protein n=1 Tax=Onchocerca volvulus TaxID=6282 RepID=A0A8R1TMS8_ONCVO
MESSNITLGDDWYSKPLNSNDIIAGGTLILLALIFLLIYILVSSVLYRESSVSYSRRIICFVYLLSSSINNMILLTNYALWPGILIIAKKRVPKNGRRLYQIYFDAMWFSMCYHTLLIAWTRYAAICRPVQFRKLKISTIYISCLMCYVIAFVQSTIAYFQPRYVTFYYEASVYGIIAEDIKLYLEGGKAQFFFIFHLLIFIGTFFFYGCALFVLVKYKWQNRKITIQNTADLPDAERRKKWSVVSNASNILQAESKLIMPCTCNAVVFVIGQVVLTVGISEGRWTLWLILVLFTLNASVDSVTLLIFSKTVRNTALAVLREIFCSNKGTVVTELEVSEISGIIFDKNIFELIINAEKAMTYIYAYNLLIFYLNELSKFS